LHLLQSRKRRNHFLSISGIFARALAPALCYADARATVAAAPGVPAPAFFNHPQEGTSMAEWKKLAIALTLADGKIDDEEVKILKKELWADGKIDKEEVKFLIELRNAAQKKAKARKEEVNAGFERLFFKAIEDNVMADGKIDAAEARWLKDMLFADGKIDANEKKFLTRLKKAAKKTSPAFDALYDQCMKSK
jgi:uncharacterized membrane protein YebE (DUF533 family)